MSVTLSSASSSRRFQKTQLRVLHGGVTHRTETLADLFHPYKQIRIAAYVGIAPQVVNGWKSGRLEVLADQVLPLAEFLRIDIGRLVSACLATAARRKREVGRAS